MRLEALILFTILPLTAACDILDGDAYPYWEKSWTRCKVDEIREDGKKISAEWLRVEYRCWDEKRPKKPDIKIDCRAAVFSLKPLYLEGDDKYRSSEDCPLKVEGEALGFSFNGDDRIAMVHGARSYEGQCEHRFKEGQNRSSCESSEQLERTKFFDEKEVTYLGSCIFPKSPSESGASESHKRDYFTLDEEKSPDHPMESCEQMGGLWTQLPGTRLYPGSCIELYEDHGFVAGGVYNPNDKYNPICENPVAFPY